MTTLTWLERRPARQFLLFLAASFLSRGVSLFIDILDIDEASYAVAAGVIRRGGMLYVDIADHHPPLAYFYYAVVQSLFGPHLLGVRVVTLALVVPGTALALAAYFGHRARGVIAGLIYVVFGASFLAHDMWAVNTEVLYLLPATWALVVVRPESGPTGGWRAAAAGLLLGVAALVKYQGGLWGLALVWAWCADRSVSSRRAAWLTTAAAAGAVLPLVAAWAAFAWAGASAEFLYWNLTHNLFYTRNSIAVGEAAMRAVRYALPFAVVVAPLAVAARRSWPHLHGAYERHLLGGLFVTTAMAAAIGWRFYPHYFIQFYVPLAIGAATWLIGPWRAGHPAPLRATMNYAAVLFAFCTVVNVVLYFGPWSVYRERLQAYGDFAAWAAADPCAPGASLFVWGYSPSFYYASHLPPASRFLFVESTLSGYVPGNRASLQDTDDAPPSSRDEHWNLLLGDLERNRATYILDTSTAKRLGWQNFSLDKFPLLTNYIAAHYEATAMVGSTRIYRRRDCAAR